MSRDLTATAVASLDDAVFRPFFAVEMLFDSPNELRLWTGLGTLSHEGNDWFGTGSLLSFDRVRETVDIAANGASVSLSGISSSVISLALSEPYQGRVCNIYFGNTTDGAANMTNVFSGYMDQMNIEEGPESSTITLLVENKLIDLERPRVARYTSSYQKSKYPGDLGLDFIEDLQDKDIVWGRAAK